jgi:hypothetical protein
MHGGSRVGSGRKKGEPNKVVALRRQANRELVEAVKAEGIAPLEYALQIMRDPSVDQKRRDAMAIAAMPFLHARLAAVEMTGQMKISHEDSLKELE